MADAPAPPEAWDDGVAYEQYVGRWSRLVAEPFVRRLAVPVGRSWLDVGCGSGALSRAVLALAERFAGVWAAVGVHPNSAAGWQDAWLDRLRALAAHPKVVAIGEIGLDYYWDKTPPATQHHALARQLDLAVELGLPVIIHNRVASEYVVRLLTAAGGLGGAEEPAARHPLAGVLHSFSADWATAEAALALGFYLGFTGPLTYKKADDLRAIAARAPLDRLLVETDAPYLAPHPYRGKRNEPAYVRLVAERLAEVRGLPYEEIAAATTANARRLFDKRRTTTADGQPRTADRRRRPAVN